jgi:hypothetical protein
LFRYTRWAHVDAALSRARDQQKRWAKLDARYVDVNQSLVVFLFGERTLMLMKRTSLSNSPWLKTHLHPPWLFLPLPGSLSTRVGIILEINDEIKMRSEHLANLLTLEVRGCTSRSHSLRKRLVS